MLTGVCTGWLRGFAAAETVVDGPAIADEKQEINWLSSGRTYAEDHYSPLAGIHAGNVKELGLTSFAELPGQRTLQSTPLAVDGVLYFSGTNGWVFAVDGRNGQKLWQFDPDLSKHPSRSHGPLFGSNRGVAFWQGKVYVATVDGRLVALEAKTGRVIWATQTLDEAGMSKIISGAPRAFNGTVIIGHGGYDTTRGYVTAYDAQTGRKAWRFYTVPGDPAKGFENAAMAMAAKTWTGEWWKRGGHGVAWDNIVYDPEFNRVYVGTASSMGGGAPGDKLFSSSIVALDAESGGYIWHYQVNPGGMLQFEPNYDATSQMILADLTIRGKARKVLMQAPKNGFFYVIDRSSGKLISAQKIGKATWADRIDLQTGRPVVARHANDKDKDGWVMVWPGAFGVHNWQKMSFHPGTGLVYIPTIKLGMQIGPGIVNFDPKEPGDGTGGLLAWDPVEQKKRWEVRYADTFWNGGTLATAGNLVFHGTGRGHLIAYDAKSGANLWSFDAGLGINAAPMTYAAGGVQYISVLVGYGGTANGSKAADYGWRFNEQPRRLLTFALGQRVPLPPGKPPRFHVKAVDNPKLIIDAALSDQGTKVYYQRCAGCHGRNLESHGSLAPDLRESVLAMNWEAFNAVVRQGALLSAGMPRFDYLSEEEVRSIYMYIRQRAREVDRSAR